METKRRQNTYKNVRKIYDHNELSETLKEKWKKDRQTDRKKERESEKAGKKAWKKEKDLYEREQNK